MLPYAECMQVAIKSGWTTTGIDVVSTFHALRDRGFVAAVYGKANGARWLRGHISIYDYDDNQKAMTLGKWLTSEESKSGVFIVGIPRHVLCVRHGTIYDAHKNSAFSRINSIYKLI